MALTVNRNVPHKEDAKQQLLPVATTAVIFKGSICILDANGFVNVAAGATAGTAFAGIAVGDIDNTAGANGDVDVLLFQSGRHKLPGTGAAAADVQDVVFAVDDEDVTNVSATNLQKVGIVSEVDGTDYWVDIEAGILVPALGA